MLSQHHTHMEIKRGANFSAYLLESGEMLSASDYKLLVGQRDTGLIPCLRSRFNGHVKLTYFPDRLVPLPSCLSDISANKFVAVFSNILVELMRVESNGLLDICKIDVNLNAFYVNVETCAVGIIYLPIAQKVSGRSTLDVFDTYCQAMFTAMREQDQLRGLIRSFAGFANTSMGRFDLLLSKIRSAYSIEEIMLDGQVIHAEYDDDLDSRLSPPTTVEPEKASRLWRLQGIAGNVPVDIQIDSGSLIVGKSRLGAQYVIRDIPTISNKHCELTVKQQRLFVRDLGSTNGTFVNGGRIASQAVVELSVGDQLAISVVTLTVSEVS